MYKYAKTLFLFLLLLFLSELKAQVAITAVPFLEINNDARSIGLGGATVALKGSKSGLHLNPAIFGRKNTLQLSSQFNTIESYGFFGTPWLTYFAGNELKIYNPKIILGFNDFSIGYQFTYFDLGKQYWIDPISPSGYNKFNSYEYAHTFSLSVPFSKYVSFGAGLNYFKSSLATGQSIGGEKINSASGVTIDIGTYAEYPVSFNLLTLTPSLGWSLTDFGYPIRYTKSAQEDPLPMMMRGGFGLRLDLEEELFGLRFLSMGFYGSLEKVMARKEEKVKTQNGVTIVTYEAVGPVEALFTSWGSYERFNGQEILKLSVWDQFRRQSGFEVTVLEILSFRYGHYYEHPENGDRVYDTFGIGIQYKYFSLDYVSIDTEERYHPLDETDFFEFTINVPIGVLSTLLNRF